MPLTQNHSLPGRHTEVVFDLNYISRELNILPGMLACAESQWALASLYFCFAGVFRSNGILLSGFTLWGMLIEPVVNGNARRVSHFPSVAYHVLVFIVIKASNQTRPTRSFVDLFGFFTPDLSSTFWISSFLSRYR